MSPLKRVLLMILLAAIWSPSFLFIKLAIPELGPLTIAASRITIGATLLLILLLLTGRNFPKNFHFWKHVGVMAIFSCALPFTLFPLAEKTIESALAAVLNGCSPVFTALLAQIFLPSDKMRPQKLLGIILSVGGLFWLFLPNLSGHMEGSLWGMSMALIAAISYGISHVYGKKFLSEHPPFVVPTAQLLVASLLLWPLAFSFETPSYLLAATPVAWTGILGLGLFGTFLAFIFYYKLLKESGATAVSTIACIFPVIAMFLGFVFLGETLSFHGLIAAAFIFMGLFMVNEFLPFERWQERLAERFR